VVLGCVPVNPTEIVEMKMRRLVGRRIGTMDDGLNWRGADEVDINGE